MCFAHRYPLILSFTEFTAAPLPQAIPKSVLSARFGLVTAKYSPVSFHSVGRLYNPLLEVLSYGLLDALVARLPVGLKSALSTTRGLCLRLYRPELEAVGFGMPVDSTLSVIWTLAKLC